MARPAKLVTVQSGNLTAEQKQEREAIEQRLRGAGDKIKAPAYLTGKQKFQFRKIVKMLEPTGILGNSDVYILSTLAIAVDRLRDIETMVNESATNLYNTRLMSTKDKYTKDLYRCCNELCLSPQSRAKMSSIQTGLNSRKDDPLLKVLMGDDD